MERVSCQALSLRHLTPGKISLFNNQLEKNRRICRPFGVRLLTAKWGMEAKMTSLSPIFSAPPDFLKSVRNR
jgi:hypothetical protein